MYVLFVRERKHYLITCFRNNEIKKTLWNVIWIQRNSFSGFSFFVYNKGLRLIALCCPLLGIFFNCIVQKMMAHGFLGPVDAFYSLTFSDYWWAILSHPLCSEPLYTATEKPCLMKRKIFTHWKNRICYRHDILKESPWAQNSLK